MGLFPFYKNPKISQIVMPWPQAILKQIMSHIVPYGHFI
jgi:hypothetical protein